MHTYSSLAGELLSAGPLVQYDAQAKRLLSHRQILAWILKCTVSEYRQASLEQIRSLIEPDFSIPDASAAPVPDRIRGDNTESLSLDGGRISYDLRFHALYPPQFHFPSGRLLINLEAQKSLRVKYHLSTRGVFYGARMLSDQLGSEFADSDYDRLNKVYSIWICMNAPKRIGNAMAIYRLTKQERVGHVPEEHRHYDKLTIVQIFLDSREEYGPPGSLHRLLNVLFSPQLDYQEKERILSREYALEMTEPLRKELEQMGNMSEAILEMGLREGRKQGKKQGLKQGRELGIRQGKAQGMKQGALQTLSSLVAEGLLTPEKAAEHLGISVEEFFRKTRHLSGLQ